MHWWQRLDALQGGYAQGVPDTRYGLTLDQATAPWKDADPKLKQAVTNAPQVPAESSDFGNFMKGVGEVLDFGDPLFKALTYPYKQLSTKVLSPITHVIPVLFNEDWQRQINADSTWDAMFDGRSWGHIMDVAEKDSFGRGFWESAKILDRGASVSHLGEFGTSDADLKDMQDDWQFDVLSGTTDFLAVMFTDPLYVSGKIVKATRALSTVREVRPGVLRTPEDFDRTMNSEPVANWLKWTDGRAPEEIASHRVLSRNPMRGQIADLLAHSSMSEKDLIYRIALGQQDALWELQRIAPSTAAQLNRMRGQVQFFQLKTLPTLTSTISSSNKAKPLSRTEKDKLLAQKRGEVDKFARDNRTTLKLNDTEFQPLMQVAWRPFSSQREAEQHVYNTFSTVYKPLREGESQLLFNQAGELQRTPDDLSAMLREYHDFRDDAVASFRAKQLSEQAGPPVGRARVNRDRMGSGLAADEPIPSRFSSPWSETKIPGQQDILNRPHITGERTAEWEKAREPIRAQLEAGLPVGVKGSAKAQRRRLEAEKVPTPERITELRQSERIARESKKTGPQEETYQQWAQRQMADNDPARFAMWDYDAAGVASYGDKMRGQLDLFDDFLTPEIRDLDSKVGFYQRILDDAVDVNQNGIRAGIFASSTTLPKGGAYGKLAEGAVKVGTAMDKAYLRRYSGEMAHYGFMSRPVYFATKMADGLGRGTIPTSFKTSNPEAWRDVDVWLKRVPDLSHAARKSWVRQLMGATDEAEKLRIVEQMEATVIRHMLHVNNVHDYETIKSITEVTLGSKKAYVGRMADDALKRAEEQAPRGSATGAYSAVENTKGLAPFGLTPDGVAMVPGPVLAKQLLNEYPLLPIDELAKAMKRDGKWLYGSGGLVIRDPIMEFSQFANRIWKTSVLLRTGYVIRTVSDEVLLAGAALGSLLYYAGGAKGAARTVGNVPTRLGNAARRAANRKAQYKRQLPEHELKAPPHERGKGPVNVGDDTFSAHGFADGPTGDIHRSLIEADQRDLYSIYDRLLQGLRTSTNWGVLRPKEEEVSHLAAWTHALNFQLGQDRLGKIFLNGGTYDDAMKWLRGPDGRSYARRMGHMADQQDDWVKSVAFMVDQYTLGDQALARAASAGKVTPAMLKKVDIEIRPPVHGGQIDYARGEGGMNDMLNSFSDAFYGLASRMPTNKLVRHPMADMMYQKRLRLLVANMEAQGVKVSQHPEKLYHLEEVARQFTVKEMHRVFKDNLFSSPQGALRFVMPFFGAWRASIARWASAVGEDPSIVARANQGWQGLHKDVDVVDADGNPLNQQRVDAKGNVVPEMIVDPRTKQLVKNPAWTAAKRRNTNEEVYGFNTQHRIVLRLPEKYAKALTAIPLVPGAISYGDAPARGIPLKSFNTVLQGDPWYNAGFGPFVTVGIADILRDKPYAANIAQKAGVLPFGTRGDWKQHALPTVWQRSITESEAFDNKQYVQTYINIWRVESVRESLGERGPVTPKEVRQKTDDLTRLRKWEAFLMPFSSTPVYYGKEQEGKLPKDWQFLAAKFRQYREAAETPEQGEEAWLRDFPDAWLYMQATSENKSKIPASFEGWDKSQKIKYLASTTPDIFDSAAGVANREYKKFDSAVYDAQMNSVWNPETGEHYRDVRDPTTFADVAKQREGWTKYSKFMDYLRGELQARKLNTVDDPGAQDLKDMKSQYLDYISETNPAWADAYGSPDLGKKRRVLEQARIIAADKSLASDPNRTMELRSLGYYLSGRDYFASQLKTRGADPNGSLNINARSNEDLLKIWNSYREYLAHKDTRFSEIWLDRYFGNDYFQELK